MIFLLVYFWIYFCSFSWVIQNCTHHVAWNSLTSLQNYALLKLDSHCWNDRWQSSETSVCEVYFFVVLAVQYSVPFKMGCFTDMNFGVNKIFRLSEGCLVSRIIWCISVTKTFLLVCVCCIEQQTTDAYKRENFVTRGKFVLVLTLSVCICNRWQVMTSSSLNPSLLSSLSTFYRWLFIDCIAVCRKFYKLWS